MRSRKRIVYLVGSMGAGGVERVVYLLATRMKQRGHLPTICCFDSRGDTIAEAVEAEGIPVHVILREDGIDWPYFGKLRRWLTRLAPDVLHMHNSTAYFYGSVSGTLAGVPTLIATEHDGVFPRSRSARISNRLLVNNTIRHAVAVSDAVRTLWCESDGIPLDRVKVIPNGVPDNSMGKTAHDKIRIGTVGRLSHEKGQDVLIQAFAPLAKARDNVELVLVGDGFEREKLEKQATDLGVTESVRFLGTRSDVSELLSSFDIFALSSRREGLPLAVLEALASSLPIVSTRVGGLPEALDGGAAVLVPPEDPDALGQALAGLIDSKAERDRLGEASRTRFLERYELTKMIDDYEALMFS